MNYIQAVILSIIEGITEFLPISSTGHLVLASSLMKISNLEFAKSFEIFIQLGAIMSVVFLYWKTLLFNKNLLSKLFISFLPTAVVGFFLYKYIKGFLLGNSLITVISLFAGGIILILFDLFYINLREPVNGAEKIGYGGAFLIGLAQSFSIIPGVSRAAATIIGGRMNGFNKKTAVEYSFLLAIPTMLAASAFDLVKSRFYFSFHDILILFVGFLISFITSLFIVEYFLKYIKDHGFMIFGIYRIVIALVYYMVFLR